MIKSFFLFTNSACRLMTKRHGAAACTGIGIGGGLWKSFHSSSTALKTSNAALLRFAISQNNLIAGVDTGDAINIKEYTFNLYVNDQLQTSSNSDQIEGKYLEKYPDLQMEITLEDRSIDFPKHMLEGVVDFLRTAPNRNEENFDCFRFVYFINTPAANRIATSAEKVIVERLSHMSEMTPAIEHKLKPGKVIVLGNAHYEPVSILGRDYLRGNILYEHWAIFLGDGLYLSQFGVNGFVGVADLENMKKAYRTEQTWTIDLKK